MSNYFTPGVYVEEISTFPTSVVRVATAVPVFIGYTEKAGAEVLNIPTKVKSLNEFESLFGGEPTGDGRSITVDLSSTFQVNSTTLGLTYYLYQSLRHFYSNGGGDAYILAVDTYANPVDKTKLIDALAVLEMADEPTLVLVPDAYGLGTQPLGEVQQAVLAHCNKMQDRFGIFDVISTNDASADMDEYRDQIGSNYLKYGAAYYPPLETSLTPNGAITVADLTITGATLSSNGVPTGTGDAVIQRFIDAPADKVALTAGNGYVDYKTEYNAIANTTGNVAANYTAELKSRINKIKQVIDVIYAFGDATKYSASFLARYGTTIDAGTPSALKTAVETLWLYEDGYREVVAANPVAGSNLVAGSYDGSAYAGAPIYVLAPMASPPSSVFGGQTTIKDAVSAARAGLATLFNEVLLILTDAKAALETDMSEDVLFSTSKIMADIRSAARAAGYTLPPSGAVAGVYASVDADRGVWKAPANVSLTAVTAVMKMRDDQLEKLNVDTSGKSINAIRLFRGQGILVYGARTLAGNDNEWRYVPVRRLFIMVEESVKKASEPFVFEPNDANTWLRIKGMIENFLLGLWRDGALAGGVPKDAFYVKVGLNQTMTAQDILEGKLIVEIGMAAVRPAEFIILKFMHKLQES